mmetsp:Transcript_446/g.560  ORF Transcript_446/g.560 Transcript_446/m.560 type:complete len:292 (+) Transcript_446:39-914(+)
MVGRAAAFVASALFLCLLSALNTRRSYQRVGSHNLQSTINRQISTPSLGALGCIRMGAWGKECLPRRRHVAVNGVQPRKKKSGVFKQMKSQSKSGIMKRIKGTYRPCVVLIDGTNMRGKFGFKWNAAGVAGLVQKWAGIHEMQGKAIVIFDNKDNKKTFVSPGEGVASIVAGDGADADQVITDAITFFHDMDINTVVATNDKKLMRECVAVCGAGMKARNFFFTNNDFAQVLNMPTNYVKLKQRASDMDDSNVLEAMNAYLSRYPEGNLAITSFHSDSDLYVSPENDQEPA